MRVFLILATAIAVANAGVGVLGPREVEEAMRLFFQHCSGSSEGGNDGSTFIYCKRSRDPEVLRDAQHELVVTPQPEAARQVVFVQPPSYTYRHNIQIKGGANQPQQTKIYVLPSKVNHQVQYDDIRAAGTPAAKPQLFFLPDEQNGIHGGNGDFRGDQSQVQQPRNAFGGNSGVVQSSAEAGTAQQTTYPQSIGQPQVQPPQLQVQPQVQNFISSASSHSASLVLPPKHYRPSRPYSGIQNSRSNFVSSVRV